jgi:hypothetical protein
MNEALKSNLSDGGTWIRLVYMMLFAVAFSLAELVAVFVVVAQFGFKLFTGEVNERLAEFGDGLAQYFGAIARFMTFHSEVRPYPFAPWPRTTAAAAPPAAVIET